MNQKVCKPERNQCKSIKVCVTEKVREQLLTKMVMWRKKLREGTK
mgnify:CR=1 FL=1